MTISLDLDQMSIEEKLRVLEALWVDLSEKAPDSIPAPQWHKDVLEERANSVEEGKSHFSAWPDAKKRIRDRFQ
ncbi:MULTISPECIES: addiction module protein [Alloalcanivorax]|uniref:addiction module protein n=1 Tax=Alloalcanivorax TaxID=3020832 RepID=UPI000C66AFE2|nr:addiction module protein [Alloalcanivorax profundimaris]MAO58204.1 hypothetical protein [Alcanivorax sp.]MBM1142723.1 addiction module protein [Alcanivorax sp. ZXX171]MCQ6261972.1 addiction module protein [Alcanivorax sp. MM125-6]UWN51860.1 hypothetical protein ASALC70_04095 [Alcanivorax sp. ALC70]MAY09594.1 hypothetical protein [Alcanivorax sp.]|tara:strand:+ start:90 stop:311 length:222 start_codon:yes stop_codon:yes gene_type:complete